MLLLMGLYLEIQRQQYLLMAIMRVHLRFQESMQLRQQEVSYGPLVYQVTSLSPKQQLINKLIKKRLLHSQHNNTIQICYKFADLKFSKLPSLSSLTHLMYTKEVYLEGGELKALELSTKIMPQFCLPIPEVLSLITTI